MERQRYVTIQEWMLELDIKENELIAYAIIYGFSQDDESTFSGSARYLSRWLGFKKKDSAYEVLKRLTAKGLVEKIEYFDHGMKLCSYKAIVPNGVVLRQTGLGAPENGDNNNRDNNSNSRESNARARMCKPTVDQIAAYCAERRNGIDAQEFFDWYESNGWKVGRNPMKDWKATVRTWESKRKKDTKPQQPKNAFDIMYAKLKARHPEMNNQTPFPIDEQ